jgi:hypothetical protein
LSKIALLIPEDLNFVGVWLSSSNYMFTSKEKARRNKKPVPEVFPGTNTLAVQHLSRSSSDSFISLLQELLRGFISLFQCDLEVGGTRAFHQLYWYQYMARGL